MPPTNSYSSQLAPPVASQWGSASFGLPPNHSVQPSTWSASPQVETRAVPSNVSNKDSETSWLRAELDKFKSSATMAETKLQEYIAAHGGTEAFGEGSPHVAELNRRVAELESREAVAAETVSELRATLAKKDAEVEDVRRKLEESERRERAAQQIIQSLQVSPGPTAGGVGSQPLATPYEGNKGVDGGALAPPPANGWPVPGAPGSGNGAHGGPPVSGSPVPAFHEATRGVHDVRAPPPANGWQVPGEPGSGNGAHAGPPVSGSPIPGAPVDQASPFHEATRGVHDAHVGPAVGGSPVPGAERQAQRPQDEGKGPVPSSPHPPPRIEVVPSVGETEDAKHRPGGEGRLREPSREPREASREPSRERSREPDGEKRRHHHHHSKDADGKERKHRSKDPSVSEPQREVPAQSGPPPDQRAAIDEILDNWRSQSAQDLVKKVFRKIDSERKGQILWQDGQCDRFCEGLFEHHHITLPDVPLATYREIFQEVKAGKNSVDGLDLNEAYKYGKKVFEMVQRIS